MITNKDGASYRCSVERMTDKITTMSKFGDAGHGGITRYTLSPEDVQARNEFKKRMEAIGAVIEVDDVANGIGPLAAVNSIVMSGGEVMQNSGLPLWILILGGVGIVVGLATMGYRVMATIGEKITELTPTRGFSAELAAAATVVLAMTFPIPPPSPG